MVKYWTGSLALDFRIPRLVMGLANQACTARVGPRWNIGLTSKLAFWLLEMLLVGPSFSVCSRWCKLWDTPLTVFPDISGKMGESWINVSDRNESSLNWVLLHIHPPINPSIHPTTHALLFTQTCLVFRLFSSYLYSTYPVWLWIRT